MYVLLPQRPLAETKGKRKLEYRTLYLLHGRTDDHTAWMRWSNIEKYVEGLGLAVVMEATQALDFREFNPGVGSNKARELIRKYVEHLHIDRPLYNAHNAMKKLVKSCEILSEVEKEIGELG